MVVSQVDAIGMTLKVATPADVDEIDYLLRGGERSHLRFQLESLPGLVRDGHITILEQGHEPLGFAYVTLDYPNSSIRGLVVRRSREAGPVLDGLLSQVLPRARALGAMSIIFIGDDNWLVPHLRRQGFLPAGQIVSLRRPGTFLPARGNHSFRVRPALERDLEHIVAIDWSAFEPYWRNGPQTMRELLEQMPHFLVATDDGRPEGYVCGTLCGTVGHVVRLAVSPEAQGLGIGTRLVSELLRRMAAEGVRSLALNTQRDNHQSQSFYRSLGFYRSEKPTSVYRYLLEDSHR